MKVTLLQENLTKGLTIANRSIATKPQLPILGNILLTAKEGRLRISATNLETGINLWLGAQIKQEGSVSIPARAFTEFVSSLPAGKIDLSLDQNSLKIKTDSHQAKFNTMAASEFPSIPFWSDQKGIQLEKETFVQAINQVAFSSSGDDSRPVYTGVNFLFGKEGLRMVATDGYRLSLKKLENIKNEKTSGNEEKQELIIPAKTLREIAYIADSNEAQNINFAVTKEANQIIFSFGDVELVSRLLEGEFPDWQKIIPQKGKTQISVDTEELTRAVKIAAIFARESANIVKFKIEDKELVISANTSQIGENKSVLNIKREGPEEKIAFNYRYLQDFLNIASKDVVRLEIDGPLAPGVFRLEGEDSFLHIIMPVRVQD